jgi:hypothetical protein
MTPATKNRRRRHLINPKFQWGHLRNILLLEVVVFAVAVLVTFSIDHLVLNPALEGGDYWRAMLWYLIALFLGLAMFLFALGLRISNRISGPLHRLSEVLAEITEGKLPDTCRFRTGDKHPELAKSMCAALGALRLQRLNQEVAWREQADLVRLLAGEHSGSAADALRDIADNADQRADELHLD